MGRQTGRTTRTARRQKRRSILAKRRQEARRQLVKRSARETRTRKTHFLETAGIMKIFDFAKFFFVVLIVGLLTKNTFAQVSEAITTTGEVLKTSSQYGSDVFLTSIILICGAALTGVYVWYVAIPNGKSHRDNTERLSTAIQTMSGQSTTTLDHAVQIRGSTDTIQKQIDRLMDCKKLEITAIQKVADKCDVDLTSELSELKGRLA